MCVAAFAFIAVILLMAWRSTNQTPGSPPLQNADRQSASPSVTIHTFDSYRRASNQAIAGESPPSPLRICLVTLQLAGLTQNSGMGVAVASLATVLASAGHTVSILYAATPRADWPHWRAHYAALGVELAMLPAADTRLWPTGRSHRVRIAWQCYQWLRERQVALNLVYFHDWHGIGYFATQAKRQALDFAQTLLATIVHCPVSFFRHGNSQHTAKITTLLADHMELNQVRSSDLVISPSRFMLDWVVRERGWTLPSGEGRVFVQPNVLSAEVLKAIPLVDHDRKQLIHANELVFFGRLEKLKGLVTFLDALDWLATMMPSERRCAKFYQTYELFENTLFTKLSQSCFCIQFQNNNHISGPNQYPRRCRNDSAAFTRCGMAVRRAISIQSRTRSCDSVPRLGQLGQARAALVCN